MNYTQNYQLPQWVETDRILMEDFNDAFSAIETALGELPQKGNCQIETGTYVGTGDYNNKSLLLSNPPLFLLVHAANAADTMFLLKDSAIALSFAGVGYHTDSVTPVRVTWSGNTVTWQRFYSENNAADCLNALGTTYCYFCLSAPAA